MVNNNTSEFENEISHTLLKLNSRVTKTLTRTINGDNLQMGSSDNNIYTNPDGLQMGSSDASPYNHQKKSTLQISTNTSKFFLNLLMEIIIHGDKEADNKDLCLRNAFKQRRMHNDLSLRVSLISQIQIQNRKE